VLDDDQGVASLFQVGSELEYCKNSADLQVRLRALVNISFGATGR
jgi:hypothetical protein